MITCRHVKALNCLRTLAQSFPYIPLFLNLLCEGQPTTYWCGQPDSFVSTRTIGYLLIFGLGRKLHRARETKCTVLVLKICVAADVVSGGDFGLGWAGYCIRQITHQLLDSLDGTRKVK